MKLLHIDSSILGDHSASRTVSGEIVARYKKAVPQLEVEHLDLVAQELPHRTGHHLAQRQVPESAVSRRPWRTSWQPMSSSSAPRRNVQLHHLDPAQVLDRPGGRRRQDLQVRPERSGGAGYQGKRRHRRHLTRRCVSGKCAVRTCRSPT